MSKVEKLIDNILNESLGSKRLSKPKSKPQFVFQKAIDTWIRNNAKYWDGPSGGLEDELLYAFHDTDSIAADGLLCDILTHGQGDFGVGKDLATDIDRALDRAGYYLEAQGGCIFNFVSDIG